jgi:hypothetical protein
MEAKVWNTRLSEPSLLQQTPTGIQPIQFEGVDILNCGDVEIVTAEVKVYQKCDEYEMMIVPQENITIGHILI